MIQMGGLTAATEQQYSLRWNDFHASILSSFRHLRDEEDFVDVTLACDGRSFTAHKVVLSACSPYFRRLLKANPCNHPIIILRDVQEKDMEALLRFMYNGEVHVGHEQLPDFLKTAQTLQVRGLADVPNKENRVPAMLNDSPWPTPGDEVPSRESAADGSLSPPPSKRSRTNEERHTPQHDRDSSRDHRERDRERERDTERRDQERERDQARDQDRDCSPAARRTPHHLLNNSVGPEHHSLLGQALEGGPQMKSGDSAHVSSHSTGEDDEESNSGSDTGISERGISGLTDMVRPKSEPSDYSMEDNNGHGPGNGALGMDSHRSPNFPAALLGLQGLPGLLPGPSGLHGSQENNFVNRRSLDMMRVRATDPRPCPKCGKIYRSAHTLRTHLEDKHTVCPGYRCVLCGTVAKSRNSLHSHMSRQHRGISTKDLPVLPMPSPFDPELASRLLAKAGVKVTAAELRARSSPTGPPRRSDMRLDLKLENNMNNMRFPGAPSETGSSIGRGDDMDDPEDLTVPTHRFGGVDITAVSPPLNNINSHHLDRERDRDRDRDRERDRDRGGGQATITKIGPPSSPRHHPPPGATMSQHHQMHGAVLAAKSMDSVRNRGGVQDAPTGPPGPPGLMGSSAILDAYLQMIAESQGLNMNSEQAAHAAAIAAHAHAAKLSAELRNKNNNEVDVDRKMMPGDPGESSAGEEEEGFSEDEPEPITAE
ncbi:protein abrupt isoform X2 [Thrips palmi]|uniref:Protein abrupt isoform X2 n=1 Tax=Thrips palmi TaxID=161013 RepID=A0A6P8XX18_THRPL|nr:protein abrupt isoform X2 [Thrips palmi]